MGALRRAAARVGRVVRRVPDAVAAVRRYVADVLGESDYERYVAHLARAHPGTVPPTRAQYWRERYADQDANPGARCC